MHKKKIVNYFFILINLRITSSLRTHDELEGEWTDWSNWSSCIGECSYGHRTRNRSCKKNYSKSENKKCLGISAMQKICRIEKKCVVNGDWSEWSPFTCNSKCGIGIKIRKRTCDNPVPSNNGSDCIGFAEEADYCSDFSRDDCLKDSEPLKFMPFDLKYLILKKLQFKAENYVQNSRRYFKCDIDLFNQVNKLFKDANIEWILNGNNEILRNSSFLMLEIEEKFTGTYFCTVKIPVFKYRIVIDFFTWIVDKEISSLYKGQSTSLFANVLNLHSILRHLNLKIKIIKDFNNIQSFSLYELPFNDPLRLRDHYFIKEVDDNSYSFILSDYNDPPKIKIITNRFKFKTKRYNLKIIIDERVFWSTCGCIIGTYLIFASLIFYYDLKALKNLAN